MAELLGLVAVYVTLVSASVALGAAALASFALITFVPLATLFVLRPEMTLIQKLAKAGLLPYVLSVLAAILWIANDPKRPIYYLIGTFCALVFFVWFAWLNNTYLFRRRS